MVSNLMTKSSLRPTCKKPTQKIENTPKTITQKYPQSIRINKRTQKHGGYKFQFLIGPDLTLPNLNPRAVNHIPLPKSNLKSITRTKVSSQNGQTQSTTLKLIITIIPTFFVGKTFLVP